ncbi:MAG: hypothetical protein P8P74_03505 [Crocinitomicaceae bacterium]|nr:hypothetical protein [Crocinitomicaceae bacterium]
MKKIHYSFLALFVAFFITSSTINSPAPKQRLFEKIIMVELNPTEDSALFQPFSKAWKERWHYSADILFDDTELMNAKKYQPSFANRFENLYTILHPMVINGTIQTYFPSDPNLDISLQTDQGELNYPLLDRTTNETFLTSEKVRSDMCYLLGKFGPESDLPLVDEYGDPMIMTADNGEMFYVYPPRDYYWFSDGDIVKYKMRISVLLNKKGKEKKRTIKSICPVVNQLSDNGEVVGESELFWLNFEELEPALEEAYFFDENMIPVTYFDYFQRKAKNLDMSGKE